MGRELWKGVLRTEASPGDFEVEEVLGGGRNRRVGAGVCPSLSTPTSTYHEREEIHHAMTLCFLEATKEMSGLF